MDQTSGTRRKATCQNPPMPSPKRLAVVLAVAATGLARPPIKIDAAPPAPTFDIKVDQVGYPAARRRLAMVASARPASEVTVIRPTVGSPAYEGMIAAPSADAVTGDQVQLADFTSLAETGSFYLDVTGVGRSWDFMVGPGVFSRALY